MTAQQSDALREIANKARVTTILQCKALERYPANTEAQRTRVQRTVRAV